MAGLRGVIQKVVSTAIAAVGDLAISVTYIATEKQTLYNPTLDKIQLEGTEYPNLAVVFAEFSSKEINGEKVRATDQKALIAFLDLPVTPKIGDRIHKSTIDHWQVQDKDIDPADGLWILQIRKVSVQILTAPN